MTLLAVKEPHPGPERRLEEEAGRERQYYQRLAVQKVPIPQEEGLKASPLPTSHLHNSVLPLTLHRTPLDVGSQRTSNGTFLTHLDAK